MKRCMALLVVMSFCVLAIHSDVSAMWEEDGNLFQSGSFESFWRPESCTDGEGGMIVGWQDYTGGHYIIHAQRIDPYGHKLWAANGVPLNSFPENNGFHRVIPDGEGGAIFVWVFNFVGDGDIYAQRIDADGNLLWGADGVAVCTASDLQYSPALVSDGMGGAIITWSDNRGADEDIYAQRIGAAGTAQWTADGVVIISQTGTQEDPDICSDNNGGAHIAWEDSRGADQDIYMRHVNANGAVSWLATGIPVCVTTGWQQLPKIESDGAGGAIIAWGDDRGVNYAAYAQRIDRDGAYRWAPNGIIISNPDLDAGYPVIMEDGQGGVFAAYYGGTGSQRYIAAQRVSSQGDTLWAGGVMLYDMEWTFEIPVIVSDDAGGIIVGWSDDRTGNFDVYAQRVDGDGAAYWEYGGRTLCGAFDDQNYARIVPDGDGGIIASYHDGRSGVQELYTQRMTAEGHWGYPCPDIYSIEDVPGDEGGQVNLAWYASRLDDKGEPTIAHYSIWRAIEESAAMLAMRSGGVMAPDALEITLDTKPGAIRTGELLGEPYFWELIGTIGAGYIETYAAVMPTLFDSTDTSPDNHYFQVMAHTGDPLTFWTSEPDSAYSVDNLAPCAPLALAGEQSFTPGGLELTWTPNEEPDLDCYRIYRGTDPGFDPGTGNLLAEQCDTLLLDEGWDWTNDYWYKVAAVDIHGNESEYAVFGPEMVTGDDPMPVPDATFLSQNYPNPFNPNTTIAFGLKAGGFVNLSVYNAAGQLVAELINESRPAGQYAAVWNGKAQNGSPAASGVYFYKLVTEEFAKTRKMILLR